MSVNTQTSINISEYYDRLKTTVRSMIFNYPSGYLINPPQAIQYVNLKLIAEENTIPTEGKSDSLIFQSYLLNLYPCKVSKLSLEQIGFIFNKLSFDNFIFYKKNNLLTTKDKPNAENLQKYFVTVHPVIELKKYDIPGFNPMINPSLRKQTGQIFGYDHVLTLFNVIDIVYAPYVKRYNQEVYNILEEKASQAGALAPLFRDTIEMSSI